MKVLLFGATGNTGKIVLSQALEQGHTVTAFVRNPSKLTLVHSNLKVMQGDVLTSALDSAITGQDAVICCLGAPATKAGTLRSEGTRNITNAMTNANVNRFICQSSLGFGDSTKVLNCCSLLFKHVIVPVILKATFKEHQLQELVIKKTNLNWTIVRPGNLTNGVKTGKYNYDFLYSDPSLKVKISRADVADFLLKQLETDQFSRKTVGISY